MGQALSIDKLRLFPRIVTDLGEEVSVLGLAAEAMFNITHTFFVSLSQVFAADAPLRYGLLYGLSDRILVRASTNFAGDSRAIVEYEARF